MRISWKRPERISHRFIVPFHLGFWRASSFWLFSYSFLGSVPSDFILLVEQLFPKFLDSILRSVFRIHKRVLLFTAHVYNVKLLENRHQNYFTIFVDKSKLWFSSARLQLVQACLCLKIHLMGQNLVKIHEKFLRVDQAIRYLKRKIGFW